MTADYWIPDAPALPANRSDLLWSTSRLDRGAAWAMKRWAEIGGGRDRYTLPLDGLMEFLTVRAARAPKWIRSAPHPAKDGVWEKKLSNAPLGRRYRLVEVPFAQEANCAVGHREGYARAFLLLRRQAGGWRLYPRSLRCHAWDRSADKMFSKEELSELTPQWDADFSALPAYATTLEEKHAGAPYRAGSIAVRESREKKETFWIHTVYAFCALLSTEGVRLPSPKNDHFSWTVKAPSTSEQTGWKYLHHPLRVPPINENPWLMNKDSRFFTPQTPELNRALLLTQDLLNKMAPNVPLFFDTLSVQFLSGERNGDGSWIGNGLLYPMATGQFFPGFTSDLLAGCGSNHHALSCLGKLPPDWVDAIAWVRAHN